MMKTLKTINVVFFALALFFMSSQMFAQVTTSSVNGTVLDKSGNPLEGVSVTAIHEPTGTVYSALTRKSGIYNISNMKVGGPYKITVEGYPDAARAGIMLSLGEDQDVSFDVKDGAKALEEIQIVGGKTSVMNSKRTGAATAISSKNLNVLPTTTRSFTDFTKLDPRSNGNLSFNGRNPLFNNITVDGSYFNNAFGLQATIGSQAGASPISLDAVEQIQVSVAPYDVRQGMSTGANINAVTRSGDNDIKGSAYFFMQNQNLTGDKVGSVTSPIANFDQKQFGFRVGGPIIKDKVFFFVSGEQEKRTAPPSPSFVASRNGSSGAGISTVNADTLQKLRDFLISKFGYDPGPFEGYNLERFSQKLNVRFDININKNHKLNVKYNMLQSYQDVLPSNSGAITSTGRTPSVYGLPFQGALYRINNNLHSFILELNSKFSSALSNNFSVGYTAMRDFRETPTASKVFPTVDIGNGQGQQMTTFGLEAFSNNNLLNSDIIQIQDNLTYYFNKHVITAGIAIEMNAFKNGFAPNYQGLYRFATLQQFYNSVNDGTTKATQFSTRYSALADGSFPYAEISGNAYSAYLQDEFKPFKGFKITAGLRLDVFAFPTSPLQNDRAAKLIFNDGNKYNTGEFPGVTPLFSPRVGFNWDVFNDKKLQVRGGAGVFTGRIPFVWLSNQASNNGVQFGSVAALTDKVFNADPNAYKPTVSSSFANTSYNLVFTDKNFKFPQVFRANLAGDYNLGDGWIVTAEALFTQDINSVYFVNVGLNTPSGNLAGSDNREVFWGKSGSTFTRASNLDRLYARGTADTPTISDAILMKNTSLGYGVSLTLQVQKQFKNGLYTSLAYTYTDAKSVNDGGSIAQSMWRDRVVSGSTNENVLSYTSNLQNHRLIAFGSYTIEYLKRFATTVGLVLSAGPDYRFSYVYAGDINGDRQTANDLIYVPKDQSDIQLVNIAASSTTAAYTAADQWKDLNNYIEQDDYLKTRRGQYAERNGGVAPWRTQVDFKFTQDVKMFDVKGKTNKIQITFDILNIGNMINSEWGVVKLLNRNALLTPVGFTADNKPTFTFDYVDKINAKPLTSTFGDNFGLASRWSMQIGVRYIFN